jgi:uncharacterized protein YwgA
MPFFDADVEKPDFDRETFENVVLYVCSKVDDLRSLSKTKLHKILYYVDREVYLETGQSLTGERYVADEYGPTSDHLDDVLTELEEKGLLSHLTREDTSRTFGSFKQNIFVAKESPDVDELFSASQVQLLDEVTRKISEDFTSGEISDISHDIVWRAARKGEEIPYYTALLQVTKPSESSEDLEWAREKAEELKA